MKEMADQLSNLSRESDGLADSQQTKYDGLQATPPPEVAVEVEQLRSRQAEVAAAMAQAERLLASARSLRRDFHGKVATVEEVLEKAADTLKERVTNVPEAKKATEVSGTMMRSVSRMHCCQKFCEEVGPDENFSSYWSVF